jgi:hypothetical protein
MWVAEITADLYFKLVFLCVLLQGTVEALQGSLSNLSAHVALRARALDPAVAAATAAAGLEGGDLDLNTLDNMEPERERGFCGF